MNQIFRLTFALTALLWMSACTSDDEAAAPPVELSLAASATSVAESATSPVTLTVSIDRELTEDLTVGFSVSSASALAGTDYTMSPRDEVTLTAGQTTATITITPIDNDAVETADRVLTVSLDDPGTSGSAILGSTTSVEVTITNDDVPGSITAGFTTVDLATNERLEETLTLTVELSAALTEEATIAATLSGTAVAGTNFVDIASPLFTFAAGETTASLDVTILEDRPIGSEPLDLVVTLSEPDSEVLALGAGASSATITILNPSAEMSLWIDNGNIYKFIRTYVSFTGEPVWFGGQADATSEGPLTIESGSHFTFGTDASTNLLDFMHPLYDPANDNYNSADAFAYYDILTDTYDDDLQDPPVLGLNWPNTPQDPGDVPGGAESAIVVEDAIELFPLNAEGTEGIARIPEGTVITVRRVDPELRTEITPSYTIPVSGEGTFKVELSQFRGDIEMLLEFDESVFNNGTQQRHYLFSNINYPQ